MKRIVPHLRFDGDAEEAAEFYAGLFPESRIGNVMRAPACNHELLKSNDRVAAERVMQAMLKMNKIDIAVLEAAAESSTGKIN
ncbi:VOC family protein [Denitrobaculum tricleocarpae]|uniref:PhnB-like domain-containing protein n=1 Tax=Denitrobaculum tricleocarpae TaxID=2591009 RepID=A0A545TPN4_9PROT|nr:VOC family protein [Denitrobaculum tricleocarpae]TQV79183.1 hypothetical protein FKG95_16095 [Denitrobaculum tricleocarpae]